MLRRDGHSDGRVDVSNLGAGNDHENTVAGRVGEHGQDLGVGVVDDHLRLGGNVVGQGIEILGELDLITGHLAVGWSAHLGVAGTNNTDTDSRGDSGTGGGSTEGGGRDVVA